MDNVTNTKVVELQHIEESLQNLLVKRESLTLQLNELNDALDNLKTSEESYKIIGNIMIKKSKDELILELEHKIDLVKTKIKNIEKHEDLLRNKSKKIQQQLINELKGKV